MKKQILTVVLLIASAGAALADDWTGQTIARPTYPPSAPGFVPLPPPVSTITPLTLICVPTPFNLALAHPLPCGPGETRNYGLGPAQTPSALPAGLGAPLSQVAIQATGHYLDPAAPAGVSDANIFIPLSDFATSSSFDALSQSTAANFAALQAQFNALGTIFASVRKFSDEGTAAAIAMGGVGDLMPDEHFAVSANWGTFGGQNAFAAGFAARVDEHFSVNGGVTTSMEDSRVGARAGIRFGW